MTRLVTGDATKNKSVQTIVTAQPQSTIDILRLQDIEDVVNQPHLSGKRQGSTLIAIDYKDEEAGVVMGLAIATGEMPDDEWLLIPASPIEGA